MDYLREMAQARYDSKLRELGGLASVLHGPAATDNGAQYSVVRALNALAADPLNPGKRAPHEASVSAGIAERIGRAPSPGGIFVPITQTRDLTVAAGGAYLVSSTIGDTFVSALRAASVTNALGVQTVPAGRDNLLIPRGLSDAATYWLANESAQITESTPIFGQIAATPKAVGAYVELSRLFLKQTSPAAERFAMSEFARAIAAAVDAAMIDGTGSLGQPLGLLGTTGIATESGAAVTWPTICAVVGDVEAANGMVSPNAAGWAIAPDAAEVLRQRAKETGGGSFILADGRIDGRPAFVSNSVPSATAVFGDWSGVMLATWGVLELGIMSHDTGSVLFKTGAAAVRVLWTVDNLVVRPASFCSLTSIS